MMRISWKELEPMAAKTVLVWAQADEVGWISQAWTALRKANLTEYSNEIERAKVFIRFVAVCDLYLDFIKIAWEEDKWSDREEWIEAFNVSDSVLGVLLAPSAIVADIDLNERDEVIRELSQMHRNEVLEALLKGMGGSIGLYESLALSKYPTARAKEEERDSVFSLSADHQDAWSWIEQGCEVLTRE